MKLVKLDNTTNMISERIEKLERCNAKLSDDMKLFEERENRRYKGARPKVLEILNSDLEDRVLEEGRKAEKSSKVKISYSDKLSKGLDDIKANALLKESKIVKEEEKKKDKLSKGLADIGAISLLKETKITEEDEKKIEAEKIRCHNSGQNSSLDLDLLAAARRCIGLYPVKPSHILKNHEDDYEISTDDIPLLHNLRDLAAKEFLNKELNWKEMVKIRTNWSQDRNILWVSFQDENLVSSIFKKQAEIKNDRIKLIKFIPSWCYERNKELEILCRLEREKDRNLRTKVLLGKDDLILSIKRKGDNFYKRVSVEFFGEIPGFNFKKTAVTSLGSPSGRRRLGGDEDDLSSTRKRSFWSGSFSATFPEESKPRTEVRGHVERRDGSYIPHSYLL